MTVWLVWLSTWCDRRSCTSSPSIDPSDQGSLASAESLHPSMVRSEQGSCDYDDDDEEDEEEQIKESMINCDFAFNNPKYADRTLRLITYVHPLNPRKHPRDDYEEVHVNTVVLAKASLYFRKMFDGDDFKESAEKVIDIVIGLNEKESFLKLIKFMYTAKLQADTFEELIGLWDVSLRFLVESCNAICLKRMKTFPLSLESSCRVLDEVVTVDRGSEFKCIEARCIVFVAKHFRVTSDMHGEFTNKWANLKDLVKLSANALQTLLSADDVQVVYEESVFYAVKMWIEVNCEGAQDKKEAWQRLAPFIRWPMIESFQIRALMSKRECKELRELLFEALEYHACTDEEKKSTASTKLHSNRRFCRRCMYATPVKFVSVNSPFSIAIVFFNIFANSWECMKFSNFIATERFTLAGCVFFWLFRLTSNRKKVSMQLVSLEKPPLSCRVCISLSILDAEGKQYMLRFTGEHRLRKESYVNGRANMSCDCFGKDIDKVIEDSRLSFQKETWFKTEVRIYEA